MAATACWVRILPSHSYGDAVCISCKILNSIYFAPLRSTGYSLVLAPPPLDLLSRRERPSASNCRLSVWAPLRLFDVSIDFPPTWTVSERTRVCVLIRQPITDGHRSPVPPVMMEGGSMCMNFGNRMGGVGMNLRALYMQVVEHCK